MAFSAPLERRLRIALGRQDLATEFLNVYNVTTAGTAEASKALVLDAAKGISTITSATITTLTSTTVNCTTLAATTANATTGNITNAALTNAAITNGSLTGNFAAGNGAKITGVTGAGGFQVLANACHLLGLWGATPIVQPAAIGELIGFTGNGETNANAVNFAANGNVGNRSYSLGDVVKALKNLGVLLVNTP